MSVGGRTLEEQVDGGEQKVVGRIGRWEMYNRDIFHHDIFIALKLTEAVVFAQNLHSIGPINILF